MEYSLAHGFGLSPWWLALEWMEDAPGNHGVGHYNQFRAWKLDRLFEFSQCCPIILMVKGLKSLPGMLVAGHYLIPVWAEF